MIVLVGLGGFLGAVLRFFVYEIISKLTHMFGYAFGTQVSSLIATFFVNVVGSFALGLLFAYVQSGDLKLLSKDIWTHFFWHRVFRGIYDIFYFFVCQCITFARRLVWAIVA